MNEGTNELDATTNIIDVSDSQNTLDNPSINTDYSPNNNLTQQQYELTISYDMSSNSEEAEKNTSHTYIKMSQETLNFIKDKFNLNIEDKIFVSIYEDTKNDSGSATADYIYEYYLENGTILNLSSIEEDVYADVYVPITDLEIAKFDLLKEYSELGYDIYNKNSRFYTDFCTPVSLGGNDITLEDRKKDKPKIIF